MMAIAVEVKDIWADKVRTLVSQIGKKNQLILSMLILALLTLAKA